MKKRRYLRPSIQKALIVIDCVLFLPLVIINDYELSFFPIYASMTIIFVAITYILLKWGKGIWVE